MKITRFQTILSISFLFLFCSCSHYYYAPDEGYLLSLGEKGDIKISAATGSAGESNGDLEKDNTSSFQAGYSPIKNLGIQGSIFSLKRVGESDDGVKPRGHGFIASGAIGGYFFIINERQKLLQEEFADPLKMRKGVLLDLYAGYGQGKAHNYYANGSNSHFDFQKSFIQGGIHWQGKMTGISYVFKVVRLDYQTGIVNKEIEQEDLVAIQGISQNNPFSLIEHSFRFHVGLKKIRFFLSTTLIPYSKEVDKLDYIGSSGHIGLILELDEIFRKKEK